MFIKIPYLSFSCTLNNTPDFIHKGDLINRNEANIGLLLTRKQQDDHFNLILWWRRVWHMYAASLLVEMNICRKYTNENEYLQDIYSYILQFQLYLHQKYPSSQKWKVVQLFPYTLYFLLPLPPSLFTSYFLSSSLSPNLLLLLANVLYCT